MAFLDPLNRKKSHIQRTVSTKKNCFAHINWMNGKKSEAVVRRFSVKRVLKNFTNFTGKHLRPATLLKRRLWYRCFAVNLAKFL